VTYAWLILGVVGMVTQLGWTGGEKGRVVSRRRRKKAVAEA
jgi:hypothetical protein